MWTSEFLTAELGLSGAESTGGFGNSNIYDAIWLRNWFKVQSHVSFAVPLLHSAAPAQRCLVPTAHSFIENKTTATETIHCYWVHVAAKKNKIKKQLPLHRSSIIPRSHTSSLILSGINTQISRSPRTLSKLLSVRTLVTRVRVPLGRSLRSSSDSRPLPKLSMEWEEMVWQSSSKE